MNPRPLPFLLAAAALAAGCGGAQIARPRPQTVIGTVPSMPASTEQTTTGAGPTGGAQGGGQANGQGVFEANGCGGCHTFKPAGATQKIGPDLDKLASYAQKAGKPVDAFAHESIVNPSAYIEKGYQDVMPKTYKSLPKPQLDALVKFLTQK
jgi:cytochrome c551/c552